MGKVWSTLPPVSISIPRAAWRGWQRQSPGNCSLSEPVLAHDDKRLCSSPYRPEPRSGFPSGLRSPPGGTWVSALLSTHLHNGCADASFAECLQAGYAPGSCFPQPWMERQAAPTVFFQIPCMRPKLAMRDPSRICTATSLWPGCEQVQPISTSSAPGDLPPDSSRHHMDTLLL